MNKGRHWISTGAIVTVSLVVACGAAVETHEDEAYEPLELDSTEQPIGNGSAVSVAQQHRRGLVIVSTGCSGTLLNRYWVLTARHCVTVNGEIQGPLLAPERVRVTAAWAPGRVGIASRVQEFATNRVVPGRADIVLFFLGAADLGPVDTQPIFARALHMGGNSMVLSGRLTTTDVVTQFGQGFETFATGVWGGLPPAVPAAGLGTYRSAQFTPSSISATGYLLDMNTLNQVGHGGDSGGPSVVTRDGIGVGIAGVQSTCHPTGYVPGSPIPEQWRWATGIEWCSYVSTEPFITEIYRSINSATPGCSRGGACAIAPIIFAATNT